ncbi:MAG: cysteine synthase A [Lachnospiraceae bacterium]|nr:cysteine synthase A [Lachnospiraceae bacterium]
MKQIKKSAMELIGHTPLLELCNYEKAYGLQAHVLAKLESFNPAGSAKDRAALFMIRDAEEKGTLKPGGTIIEPTSGNTGIGLASIAAMKGYHAILTMPDTMSVERRQLLSAYGAEIILTEGSRGMEGAIARAEELQREIPGSIVLGQFVNPANAKAHFCTTGPEIWQDTDGDVDVFVAGIGTGGTITGIGEYLKSQKKDVRIVGVEPAGSPFLTEGRSGAHGLMGIGAGFKPEILNLEICDEIMTVTDEDAYRAGRDMAEREGLLVGITAGAALWAAEQIARRPEMKGRTIVALMPDTGDHYLSTPLFQK